MGKKFELTLVEYQRTMVVRNPIEIEVDNYPELEGKTEQEMIDYIKENFWDMEPTPNGEDWGAENLHDELTEEEIIREKDLGTETELEVELK